MTGERVRAPSPLCPALGTRPQRVAISFIPSSNPPSFFAILSPFLGQTCRVLRVSPTTPRLPRTPFSCDLWFSEPQSKPSPLLCYRFDVLKSAKTTLFSFDFLPPRAPLPFSYKPESELRPRSSMSPFTGPQTTSSTLFEICTGGVAGPPTSPPIIIFMHPFLQDLSAG